MRTRQMGSTDLRLTTVGLGTWPMGGEVGAMNWGPQDDEISVNTIIDAMEKGINWLDTAPAYGRGHSEEVVGMALKRIPKSKWPIITTKCGSIWDENNKSGFRLDRASVRAQCEGSLHRMGIDVIDLYLVHWPMPLEYMEEGWQTCADLVKEGKVRYIGVSNFSPEQMDRLQPIHPIACMEPPYSMIERRAEKEMLPYCKAHNMGVVVYSALQQGILTGVIRSPEDLAPSDFRRNNIHFKEPELSVNLKLVADLTPIAKKYNATVAQVAIAWCLSNPVVTSALNGARSPSEMDDSIKAGDLELSKEDLDTIEKLLDERSKKLPPPMPGGPFGGGGPGGPPGGGPPGGGPGGPGGGPGGGRR
jgi:aryl-alcohol dehydrogenase-like predicted oxidoreductase